MLIQKIVLVCLLVVIQFSAFSQEVVGKWKMIDDENGKARSIVQIYEKDGKIFGKVLELLDPKKKDAVCKECDDYRKDKKVEGMVVIEDMQKEGSTYKDGQILNPDSGKFYRCKIWLDEDNSELLHVRGYLAFFYRTQTWHRVN
ncbi:Uncharacterized conserved protein, DUF2147 family [Pustulibacterium marinum]|uniref:Uncharacterized conserved protein, DUF2147 family n=1 Tax=Pustulibacterium marinum TaxID=1224947 RepID=A0A1I7FTB6_9FLAO|nr:DUF2147 domain-containing protein [Pustulibacterium marinum]SFU39425.1 Uncharacterized conserved protein, DUF2147 family [Pustulibacterium marinum]